METMGRREERLQLERARRKRLIAQSHEHVRTLPKRGLKRVASYLQHQELSQRSRQPTHSPGTVVSKRCGLAQGKQEGSHVVLIEGVSVVVLGDGFDARYEGGWAAFLASINTHTLCADDQIAARSFLTSEDAVAFVKELRARGLDVSDIAVADQTRGLLTECEWCEFGAAQLGKLGRVALCRMSGSADSSLFTPPGWRYQASLSERVARLGAPPRVFDYYGVLD